MVTEKDLEIGAVATRSVTKVTLGAGTVAISIVSLHGISLLLLAVTIGRRSRRYLRGGIFGCSGGDTVLMLVHVALLGTACGSFDRVYGRRILVDASLLYHGTILVLEHIPVTIAVLGTGCISLVRACRTHREHNGPNEQEDCSDCKKWGS
jgi:hypothetical protein